MVSQCTAQQDSRHEAVDGMAGGASLLKELGAHSSVVCILYKGIQGPQRGCREPVPHSVNERGCGIRILQKKYSSANGACSKVQAMRCPQIRIFVRLPQVLNLQQRHRGHRLSYQCLWPSRCRAQCCNGHHGSFCGCIKRAFPSAAPCYIRACCHDGAL